MHVSHLLVMVVSACIETLLVDHIFLNTVCKYRMYFTKVTLLSYMVFVCDVFLSEALIDYVAQQVVAAFDMHFEGFMSAHHFFSLLNKKSMLHIAKHLLLELWLSNTNPQTP